MKKLLAFLTVFLLILFAFACSEDENPVNPSNPSLTGSWKGTATFMSIAVGYMNANLSQSGTSVTGSSEIYGTFVGMDTINCSVTGSNNYPNVEIKSTAPAPGGMYMLTFTGTFVNKDSLSGSIKDESSGISYPMGIKRQ